MEATLKKGNMPVHAPEFLKERKFLIMIPVLIFPFLTMAFWALGGGRNSNYPGSDQATVKGLNTTLPQAQFKNESDQDKMGVYQTTLKDSNARTTETEGVSKNFISAMGFGEQSATESAAGSSSSLSANLTTSDPNEAKIQAKLAQIDRQLNQPSTPVQTSGYEPQVNTGTEVKRLQMMMAAMNSGSGEDPEMKQLSRMLQQINDIQNPGNADQVLRARSLKNRNRVYAVTAANDDGDDYGDGSTVSYASNRSADRPNAEGNTIQAVIHEDQTLVSGAVVKLRLVDGIYVKGKMIPKGSFVYGTCALNNERLDIKISSIRYLNNILPVALTVYDLDGLEGLYVPGSISRDAAKNGVSNAVSSMQLMTMDQSLGAQAAGAGIEAAKGLFGKKVKQIKIKVKAGYEVLLKDNNDRDN
ncbi:conjugative transposon protein TraM [Mucilaginibacter pallidiroseus]|uniref:Conjugative transposon protein TraM n=1 Tax=Mucilaginibacter pallidiroseus TaxID=2599295 RepID=A0A563TZR0_9SPHI|nr:conjugative transposon protein TraM [Mucilaginibacter pallidiroseus]TWR24773.1 conjugative transposon protein TraM [Mucilaginibacter pallidiroseus]